MSNAQGQVIGIGDSTDHNIYPLVKIAHELYMEEINVYEDDFRRVQRQMRRHFLPLNYVREIAFVLGRQITLEELNLLVGLDGGGAHCAIENRDFQPVWWIEITPFLIKKIGSHGAVTREVLDSDRHLVCNGQFFQHPEEGKFELYPVAGVPFYWKRDEECLFAQWSNLNRVRQMNNYQYGHPRGTAQSIMVHRKRRYVSYCERQRGLVQLGKAFVDARRRKVG